MNTNVVVPPTEVAPAAQPDTLPPSQPASGLAGLRERFAALSLQRKLVFGAGVAALVAIFAALLFLLFGSNNSYKVLYANLGDKDGGAVIGQLTQMGIPYKFAEGSTAILVPADQVHDARLKLAAAGLPKGSVVGFELMDNTRFGITQFQERLSFQRGLEGELTRTITALSAVQDARVHLALPNQNGFFRAQQSPSASVMLSLHPGRTLDRSQLAGIVHLVSSSVPEMDAKAVSVIDQNGNLLSATAEAGNGLDTQQLRYTSQVEALYTQRILDILEPVVGAGNLRAQVTAEIDFSESQSTSEEFRPNQDISQAAVRSHRQSSATGNELARLPSGVPGAASNQPPEAVTAPVNGPAQQMQVAGQRGANPTGGNQRSESVTNYEVDKTVRVTRAASGGIKRLNAAVVVNHRAVVNSEGQTSHVALSEDELAKLTVLVQESIGFNAERGDSVKVVDAPFRVDSGEPDLPLWQQPEVLNLAGNAVLPLVLGLLALVLIFAVIRPALRPAARHDPQEPKLRAIVDETPLLPGPGGVDMAASSLPAVSKPKPLDERLEAARHLARDNPAAVANIVRGWVTPPQT